MQKVNAQFEYLLVDTPKGPLNSSVLEDLLNVYGLEGWELVTLDYGSFILKRSRSLGAKSR